MDSPFIVEQNGRPNSSEWSVQAYTFKGRPLLVLINAKSAQEHIWLGPRKPRWREEILNEPRQRTRIATVRLLLSSWSSSVARRRRFECYSRTDAPLFLSRYSCFKSLNCLAVCHRRIVLLVRHSTDRSILYRENIPRIGKGFLRKFVALNKPSDDTLRSGLTRCKGRSFIILYSVLCWIIEELLFNLCPSYFLNYIFSIIFDLIMF